LGNPQQIDKFQILNPKSKIVENAKVPKCQNVKIPNPKFQIQNKFQIPNSKFKTISNF